MCKDATTYLLSADAMLEQGYPLTSYPTPATAISRQIARNLDPRPALDLQTVDFPLWQQDDGWIQTPWPSANELNILGRDLRILGVDCEMCKTKNGSVLTRISIVDSLGQIVYDTLVKPEEAIVDYLTRFSGMTEQRLENVTTRLVDVQKRLAELIDFDTVLVGHSLESDLRALKLAHPWVIDTSVIYQHPRGPPFKPGLKWLAQKWLNKEIQSASVPTSNGSAIFGHDSEEDARTAIELLRKKLTKGPGFGEFVNDTESIFDRLSREKGTACHAAVIDTSGGFYPGHASRAKTIVNATTDEEVVHGVLSNVSSHRVVFARLMDLSHALSWSTPQLLRLRNEASPNDGNSNALDAQLDPCTTPTATATVSVSAPAPAPVSASASASASTSTSTSTSTSPSPSPIVSASPSSLDAAYSKLNSCLDRLHQGLPPRTALIIFTGHSDPREMGRLSQKKAKFDRLYKNQLNSSCGEGSSVVIAQEDRWMAEDERCLMDAVEQCKFGLSFYRVRH